MITHVFLAFFVFALISCLVFTAPRYGIPLTLMVLASLAEVRRWLIPSSGYFANDPLIMAAPAVVICYFAVLANKRGWQLETRVGQLILCLLSLMFLQIFNPAQGGLTVGVAGGLFYIIPLLWYYVGRAKATPLVVRWTLWAVPVVAVGAAALGLSQTWFGFSPSEQQWIDFSHYRQQVGSTMRPFSCFPSPAEYGQFLALGITLCWAACLRRNLLAFVPIPFLMSALFLLGIRGFLVNSLFSAALLWSIQGKTLKSWLPRTLFAACIGVAGLVWSLHQVQTVNFDPRVEQLAMHQVDGLLDPGGTSTSTSGVHFDMVQSFIVSGFTRPLGLGLGATTMAAGKYGGVGASSEVDISNLYVSLGFVGGLLYTYIVGYVFFMGFRLWLQTRDSQVLALLGVVVVSFGQWLNGGHYAGSMLAMFCVGALDRAQYQLSRQPVAASLPPPALAPPMPPPFRGPIPPRYPRRRPQPHVTRPIASARGQATRPR